MERECGSSTASENASIGDSFSSGDDETRSKLSPFADNFIPVRMKIQDALQQKLTAWTEHYYSQIATSDDNNVSDNTFFAPPTPPRNPELAIVGKLDFSWQNFAKDEWADDENEESLAHSQGAGADVDFRHSGIGISFKFPGEKIWDLVDEHRAPLHFLRFLPQKIPDDVFAGQSNLVVTSEPFFDGCLQSVVKKCKEHARRMLSPEFNLDFVIESSLGIGGCETMEVLYTQTSKDSGRCIYVWTVLILAFSRMISLQITAPEGFLELSSLRTVLRSISIQRPLDPSAPSWQPKVSTADTTQTESWDTVPATFVHSPYGPVIVN